MKILFDECVNGRLARDLVGHDVSTIGRMRWKGLSNGRLLRRAVDAGFQDLLTVDKNLTFQNDISAFPIAVFVLRVRSNRIDDIRPLVPRLLAALAVPVPGTVLVFGP